MRKYSGIVLSILIFCTNSVLSEKYLSLSGPAGPINSASYVYMGGACIAHWANPSVSWYLSTKVLPDDRTLAEVQSAIQSAYNTWQNVSTATISFNYSGTTFASDGNDGLNVHYWAEDGHWIYSDPLHGTSGWSGTIMITINENEEFMDVDVIYNNNYYWTVNDIMPSFDIQSVATHEIGHTIGIGHSENGNALMASGYAMGTLERSLTYDDQVAVSFLYVGNIIDNETFEMVGLISVDWDWNVKENASIIMNTKAVVCKPLTRINIRGLVDLNHVLFQGVGDGYSVWKGIHLEGSGTYGSAIVDCTIQEAENGIYLNYASNANIEYNTIENCTVGVRLNNIGSDSYVRYNTINNWTHCAIENYKSSLNASYNTLSGNGGSFGYAMVSDPSPWFGANNNIIFGANVGGYFTDSSNGNFYANEFYSCPYACVKNSDTGYGSLYVSNTLKNTGANYHVVNSRSGYTMNADGNIWYCKNGYIQ